MSIIGLFTAKQKIEKAKDTVKKEIAEFKKETGADKTTEQFLHKAKMKNVLIVRVRSYSVGTIAAMLLGAEENVTANDEKGQYQIVTKEGTEIFEADMGMTFLTDRDILTVYDVANGRKNIGTIKQWIVSMGIPLLEKQTKTCTVSLGEDKLCDLKRYISFGELQFDTLDGKTEVKVKSEGNYSIYYKGKKIAELHELPIKAIDSFVDRYVLEYKEEKDRYIAVMMAIALDVVNV